MILMEKKLFILLRFENRTTLEQLVHSRTSFSCCCKQPR